MRYYLDTEFVDDGKTIDLISIGIVCEDGRELYLQSVEIDQRKASEWVKENVLKQLLMCPQTHHIRHEIDGLYRTDKAYHRKYGGQCIDQQRGLIHNCPWRTREQMKRDIQLFFNPSDGIELIGWCAGYDFVAFCQLFGTMMDVPRGYPHYIQDIQFLLDERGIPDEALPVPEGQAHNALADAKHIQQIWRWLQHEQIAIGGDKS